MAQVSVRAAKKSRASSLGARSAPLLPFPPGFWNAAVARDVAIGLLFLLGLLTIVALLFPTGALTAPLSGAVTGLLGWCAPLAPAWMLLLAALRVWASVQSKIP